MAASAQVRGKISEIELQIIQVNQDLSSEVAKELREITARSRVHRAKVTREDQLKRSIYARRKTAWSTNSTFTRSAAS